MKAFRFGLAGVEDGRYEIREPRNGSEEESKQAADLIKLRLESLFANAKQWFVYGLESYLERAQWQIQKFRLHEFLFLLASVPVECRSQELTERLFQPAWNAWLFTDARLRSMHLDRLGVIEEANLYLRIAMRAVSVPQMGSKGERQAVQKAFINILAAAAPKSDLAMQLLEILAHELPHGESVDEIGKHAFDAWIQKGLPEKIYSRRAMNVGSEDEKKIESRRSENRENDEEEKR